MGRAPLRLGSATKWVDPPAVAERRGRARKKKQSSALAIQPSGTLQDLLRQLALDSARVPMDHGGSRAWVAALAHVIESNKESGEDG